MSKVKLSEATLFDDIYLLKGTTLRFISYSVVAIVIGFVTHFPVKSILINNIEKALATLPCRLEYQALDLGFFPPAVMLKSAKVPAGCFGDNGQIKLSQFKINLGLPSLYPLGLKLHTLVTSDKSVLHIYPLLTFSGIVIKIEDSVIDHALINALSSKIKIRGKFNPEILMKLKGNVVESAEFKIEGQQFQIMGQNIMGFELPDLNFQKLSTAGTLEGENLNLKKAELGDNNSPVVARIKGLIRLNQVNALFSNLDLEAEMKFSDQFLQNFSILNLVWRLDQQTKHDGYYKMRLRGPLTSLQNPEFL
ncbi:MAG: hypothetical protein COW00_03680 [Bdellovibrio sp. CG12_big_fil_rev_8_21_14_0_65_39_13]|nr:MAG: hypothetical protein COW78_14755 [Bdellovibrio sp. CG22_combo_CG10-13_8_21_14_all_39_27]PIQ61463.1 MAG: hypothetical protein COW00_03680 [Bdellovibrio sp. CG12_big_fil_rev_8_21_14_0_65_39_13]PIR35309.1 MAG: hypothetical protein COV37_09445 [Bdellovibrio sp. CG11_big_fil_rev_8_21_14_0_20_39_38]PJB53254.1 MAG: hypothetical protein CO099_08145 [Bdellovibrio sp. CG_4_9_14_3_um_filter_39_7]